MSADDWGGTGLYDLHHLTTSVAEGHWVAAGLHGTLTGIEGASALTDPFGTLITWGAGWVIEHLEPLAGWFDDLAGEPDLIRARAQSMYAAAGAITALADDTADATRVSLGSMAGAAVAAGLSRGGAVAYELVDLGRAARAMGEGLDKAAALVEGVRGLLRDLIADIVSWAVQKLLGVGALLVVKDLVDYVGTKVPRARRLFEALTTSMSALSKLLDQLRCALADATATARRVLRRPPVGPTPPLLDRVAGSLRQNAAEAGLGIGARTEDDARNRAPEPSTTRVPDQMRQAPGW